MELQKLRLKRNLTQKQLAEKTGLSLSSIRKLEQGLMNPSLATIEKLSKALNYSYQTILDAITKR